MPIPQKQADESEEDFLARCMADAVMSREFPDQEQRAAVCLRQARAKPVSLAAIDLPLQGLDYDPACLVSHSGFWAVLPSWFMAVVEAIKSGVRQPMTAEEIRQKKIKQDERRYAVEDGVAIVRMIDFLSKGFSKYGGTSTIATRQAIRQALTDKDVGSILLAIDSPGGTVAGTQELADLVRLADSIKPTFAHISDLGASAAYWVASQARMIFANRTAEIGSIGTVAVVTDTSEQSEKAGVKVHVVSTGAYKGAFTEGAPVTPEHLKHLQERVEDLNQPFLASVSEGRGMDTKRLESVADGRVFVAPKAFRLGLIDAIHPFEHTLGIAAQEGRADELRQHDKSAVLARFAKIRLAEMKNHR